MTRLLCLAVLFAITMASPLSGQEKKKAKPRPSLSQLKWLAGSWSGKIGDSDSEEHWLEPKANLMLGVNRSVRSAGRTSFEFLRIQSGPKGIVYHASPGGRPPTPFTLVSLSKKKVVFENLKHDFPQRIIYERSDRTLKARIEGKINGKSQSMEWSWKRMKGK